ncbi:MAG: CoA-binding protein [Verrucomicrobia bacterium]|nr:CoA-binding protein [Verrucomicrobiota bacterium]
MNACEMPLQNAGREEIQHILATARTVAIVGLSNKPHRDSYQVGAYLQQHGYTVIPVTPKSIEILGEKTYPSLQEVPGTVDIVNIFRKPEAVPEIVDAAIGIGAKAVWMQLGIVHNAAADRARAAGLKVVMSRCIMVEHRRVHPAPADAGATVKPHQPN